MILLGCLLAFSAAFAPRLVLILAWIFSDRWPIVWGTDWIMPLLGIIFLPYTTIMYLLAWSPAGPGGANIEGWDWMWILMGVFLDIWKWSQIIANRREAQAQVVKYYPSGAPRYPTSSSGAAASGGRAPSSAPAAAPPPPEPAAPPAPEPEAPRASEEDKGSGS